MATYDAGIVTAYGAAVRGGYTGTYEQFCAQQANYAASAAAVEQAKEDVEELIKTIPEDYSQLSANVSELDDRVTALEEGGTGSGLTDDIKQALLQIAEKVAYIDEDGQDYYDDLYDALYPPVDLVSISAVYTQSGTVYTTDTLDSLKSDLVVTAHYSDQTTGTVTTYTLSGTLTAGTSTITVSYSGKTTTFTVTVTAAPTLSSISAVYTQSGTVYDTDTLDSLKTDLVVTATYSDQTTETVTDYVLSGTLTEGTSTITVSYGGKSTTFSVTVSIWKIVITNNDVGVGFGSVDYAKPTTTPPYVSNTNKNRIHCIGADALGYAIDENTSYKITITSSLHTEGVTIIYFNEDGLSELESVSTVSTSNKSSLSFTDLTEDQIEITPPVINNKPAVTMWVTFRKNSSSGTWTALDNSIFPVTITKVSEA